MMARESKEQIIKKNIGIVKNIVNKFTLKFGVGIRDLDDLKEDLIQEGILALLKCYDKFDSKQGTKFSTYCYTYVFGAVQMQVALLFPAMRTPHTKINSTHYAYDLDDIQLNQKHCLLTFDENIQDLELDYESNIDSLLHGITPAQKDAIMLHYGLITESKFPKLKPQRPFLVKTGMIKLKRLHKELPQDE